MGEIPVGIRILQVISSKTCPGQQNSALKWYKMSIFVLTFISYTCYHTSRKPLSVVKTYFNRSCENVIPPPDVFINDSNRETWCDWAPFYGPEASTTLTYLDFAFLITYAVAMFFSGFLAERMSIRYFLAIGMITSGISCYLLGIAHSRDIHSVSYFVIAQVFGGIVQTSGWPGVVTVMGNWFGKKKRGFIFGLWNSHTSLGNILGGLIASYYLDIDWGLSFIVPGVMIAMAGFLNFLFLVDSPSDVGCALPEIQEQPCNSTRQSNSYPVNEQEQEESAGSETELLVVQSQQPNTYARGSKAIGFLGALAIPGVIEYSLCLFFSKFVSYTFLYWLPVYVKFSTHLSPKDSSDLSTIFDFGGVIGGIVAGIITDTTGLSATTCAVMLVISIPFLWLYYIYGAFNLASDIVLLIFLGVFINGPYALITTAVSTELGTHKSLTDSSRALATVSAIIDGTGSVGAAVGPLLTGLIISVSQWRNVFYLLITSEILALLMLTRLVRKEWKAHET